eukprot:GEMP01025493.1.p1 GENE.GEMP01025493.1~~GEMP01025493.1.p1  ORF type:complete len:668 (+),score=82.81 GEMP01025493.1:176-2179(+)
MQFCIYDESVCVDKKKHINYIYINIQMNLLSKCWSPDRVTSRRTKASRIGTVSGFPMYCVPLSTVLRMKSVEKHEVLLARDELVTHNLCDDEPVIFVSHQWLSVNHPDPEAEQFTVLQEAIRNLLAGYVVRSDWLHSLLAMQDEVDDNWPTFLQNALVWYDYFSVPQEESNIGDCKLAIASIPAYVEMSTITFILAPAIYHKQLIDSNGEASICDYFSWSQRGWCRMELLATHLKVNARSPLVILSERFMYFVSTGFVTPLSCVAEGKFTCCHLNHQRIGAAAVVCDKRVLFDVVQALIAHRLQYERRNNNLRFVRQIKSYSHIWLRGLREVEDIYNAHENTLDAFLTHYEFATSCVVDEGWTPLRFACLSGNVNVARQLIDDNADVEANMKTSDGNNFPVDKGMSILSHVMLLCCCLEHEEILNLLITHSANLRSAKDMDALTSASLSLSPRKRGARWLLRTFPDWNTNTQSVGQDMVGLSRWPLFVTLSMCADIDYVRLLCAHKADITLQGFPVSLDSFVTACAVCPTSSPDIAEYLLREDQRRRQEDSASSTTSTNTSVCLDVNRRLTISCWNRIALRVLRGIHLGPWALVDYSLRFVDSTALLVAASEGKHRICKWLLDQKADASVPNMNGETALSLAQQRGFTRVVDVLCSPPARRVGKREE